MEQRVIFDEKGCSLITKQGNGILCEPISSEEAAMWEAKHRY